MAGNNPWRNPAEITLYPPTDSNNGELSDEENFPVVPQDILDQWTRATLGGSSSNMDMQTEGQPAPEASPAPYTPGSRFDGHWERNARGQLHFVTDHTYQEKKDGQK